MKKLLIAIIVLAAFQGEVYAQRAIPADPLGGTPIVLFYVTVGFIMVLSLLILIVAFYVLKILNHLTGEVTVEQVEQQPIAFKKEPRPWAKLNQWLTRSTPIEKEETVMLDHSYDGIRELDNHLPPWWKALLYGSIVWAAMYLFVYHVSSSFPLPIEEYNNEIAYAELQMKKRQDANPERVQIDENTVTFVTDKAALQDGKETFDNVCASCHRLDGGGDIGPNLTDAYWKHGGSIKDLFRVVVDGVPSTNMISWSASLSSDKIQNVSSYILTLKGTSPPNAKSPEGELYDPEKAAEAVEVTEQPTEDI